MQIEKRIVARAFELRTDDDAPPVLEGYASVFDYEYDLGPFTEKVSRSAFNRTLAAEPDVRLLIDHEGQPLARTKSGTLQLTVDDTGLHCRAELDTSDPDVQRLLPKMRRGDMSEMSFAFRVSANGDEWDFSGPKAARTLTDVSINGGDVSVVTYPASDATTASIREARCLLVERASRELRTGRELPAGTLLQLRQALAAIEAETRMSANDTFASLQEAVSDTFGGERKSAWVEDYDEAFVFFTVYDWAEGDADMYRAGYSLAADGMATLSGDAAQVRRRSVYVPVTDPDGDQTLPTDDAERAADEESLEQREEQPPVIEVPRRSANDARRVVEALRVKRAA